MQQVGTNLELLEKVGAENIFMFGKCADEICNMHDYRPYDLLCSDERLKNIFGLIEASAKYS